MTDLILMTSGFGQFHSNEPDPQKPEKKLTGYATITFAGIRALVEKPQKTDKPQAQWFIPSDLATRNYKQQENAGRYYCLWADLDQTPPPLSELQAIFADILGGADFELYNSRSAKADNQKARALILLNESMAFCDWAFCQEILNDRLEALGIIPDRANQRAAQLCYLPNQGAFYQHISIRKGQCFSPFETWAAELTVKREELNEQHKALEAAKQAASERKATLSLSTSPDLITAFNRAYTPDYWLLSADYAQKGRSFRHPQSETGNYSATMREDANGLLRVNALSSSDPLYSKGGARDSFDCFTVLVHGGDRKAALRDAGDNLLLIDGVSFNRAKQAEYRKAKAAEAEQKAPAPAPITQAQQYTEPSNYNDILDNERRYCEVNLLQFIDDNALIKQLSQQVAAITDVPESTVFLTGLAVFSSTAARRWCVSYRDGKSLPLGLYVVAEQPSGTGKSRCLNVFQAPFFKAQKIALKNIRARIKELEEQADLSESDARELKQLENREAVLFITNTTAEGLEATLEHTNGFFSAVSSEQGLFDSLLGLSYSSGKNNNDTTLNGFDGGYVSSCRAKRKGYVGEAVGGIVCFAQQGSIEKVLDSSNGTGLSERFLMLAEQHALGNRDHAKQVSHNQSLEIDYAKICEFAIDILEVPKDFADLSCLLISEQGHQFITDYRNKIEPHLADGGVFSHVALRGAASKVNMQIMKIAAVLHLLDGCGAYQYNIPDKHVDSAISICDELLKASLKLCRAKGILGVKAEFTAVLNYLTSRNMPKSERDLINSLRNTHPFKDYTGNRTDLIKKTLSEMHRQRLLTIGCVGDKSLYSLAQ